MNVLVTGSSGFVGSHLARRLQEDGHHFVRPMDVKLPKGYAKGSVDHTWLRDIRDKKIENAYHEIDMVVHCAAMVDEAMCLANIPEAIDVNVTGTVNVLQYCVARGIKRFIFISSAEVYGHCAEEVRESIPLTPITVCGATKLMAEYFVNDFHRRFGTDTIILRPFNIYGPDMNISEKPLSVMARFIRNLMEGKKLPMYDEGKSVQDFIFIDDVIDAILLAINTTNEDAIGDTFNLATGNSINMIQLAKMISNKMEKEFEVELPSKGRDKVRYSVGNPSHATDVLGFSAKTDLVDGIMKTIKWMSTITFAPRKEKV